MKNTVYLVEDNLEISELIDYLLTAINLEVRIFTTIAGFRNELPHLSPGLVILDIMLPDGNGIDVCRELKADELTRGIPVILMSAHINIKTKALESGADDFISKPFDIDDFIATVERYVG